ncbi:MAG: DUF4383 domain-containing protein [Acidimicrobiia bacterium]|nr:DUF4383 domain-containing protein [Acidimicrobiia bacterium]
MTAERRIIWDVPSPVPPLSLLQVLAVALGGFFIVFGSVALARTGVQAWTGVEATVWGFRHNSLLAVIEILVGLFILSASPSAPAARSALVGFGTLLAVCGAFMVLEPDVLRDVLGINRQVGVLYAATGAGAVALGALVPIRQ